MPVSQDLQRFLIQKGVMPQTAQRAGAAIEARLTRAQPLSEEEEELVQLFLATPGGAGAVHAWPSKWKGFANAGNSNAAGAASGQSKWKMFSFDGKGTDVASLAERVARAFSSTAGGSPNV